MVGGRGRRLLLTAAALSMLVGAETAQAGGGTVRDGNDRPGPLDIRSASQGHAGTRVTHTIRTFANWPIALLGPNTPNFVLLQISTKPGPAPERIVLLFSSSGRMVAGVFSRNGNFLGRAKASRPNRHAVRVVITRARLGNPVGYRWQAQTFFRAAGPCSGGCLDRAPNGSNQRLHDLRAPTISFPQPGVVQSGEYDIGFSVSDLGFSGVRWRIQNRLFGTASWTTVESAATRGPQVYSHSATDGQDDQFRVIAIDGHGNTTTSPVRTVSVPVDDTSFSYGGTWTFSTPGDACFMTLHESTEVDATATHTFTGRYVALVAPGGVGTAQVAIDGGLPVPVDLSAFSGPRRLVFETTLATAAPHTLVVTVSSGTVQVDGVIDR
jgi:hypothetical protein